MSGTDSQKQTRNAQREALAKPFEVVAIAAGAGFFVLLIVLLTLQDMTLALIFAGIAMVVTLVVMALLLLNYKPNAPVAVYLDRQLVESEDPGAKGAALRPYIDENGAAASSDTASESN